MKLTRIAGLTLAVAAVVQAQNGIVQNAATYNSGGAGLAGIITAYVVQNPFSSGDDELILGSDNIVSPRMLAVLIYPAVSDIGGNPEASTVNATLFLRPVGSSTTIPVTVTNAVNGAITFVVPAGMPLGGAELLYQINGGPTQWTTVSVVQSSFAFFTNGPGGTAIAQVIVPFGSPGGSVGLTTPIEPGQILQLTGSGLGYGSTVSATIGGMPAQVFYAGPSATQAGQDQILLQVPFDVSDGCYVPVMFTYNNTTVPTAISVTSDGTPCKHPWQLSVNDMKTLDNGGYLAAGEIELSTELGVVTAAAGSRIETASMEETEVNAAALAGYFAPPPSAAGCQIPALSDLFVAVFSGFFGLYPATLPDIGTTVTLTSPTAPITLSNDGFGYFTTTALPNATDGPLSNLPTPAIAGGKWTFQSSGGMDLGPSSFGFSLPAPIQLAAGAPVPMNHMQAQTIAWNGAVFDAGATAFVSLQGSNGFISCVAPASAGTITIPAPLLAGFSANTIGTLTVSLTEAGAYLPHAEFQLNNGNPMLIFASFSSSDSRPVFFQ